MRFGTFLVALALVSCGDDPSLSDTPTKEQAVKYVEGRVGADGSGRKLLWYVPYKPEVQAHGATAEPARSLVAYQEAGYCFLYDLGTQSRYLVECRTEAPKGTVKP